MLKYNLDNSCERYLEKKYNKIRTQNKLLVSSNQTNPEFLPQTKVYFSILGSEKNIFIISCSFSNIILQVFLMYILYETIVKIL